ncbi:hypothetical protein, partial [Candidatus Pelagibacter sp. HIMB1593]|uniref:hypothetical protein n=1 Tax=Candidatus Pelagibacter sp. HIMB1593 TaxID=3413355 RepID=UPI003F83080D
FNKIKYSILLILFTFYLVSILPISDADSIALHQNLSNEIFLKGLSNINFEKNLSFSIFSNTHSLLIVSPSLNSDNFGAQLNILTLIFFFFSNFNNKKNFYLILLSCPLIIYLISVQKLQLFFGILYLIIFIHVNERKIKSKLELFLIIFLLAFYSSGISSYILFSIPLFIYIFIQNKEVWKRLISYSILSFVIIWLPLLILKQIYFENILAPFLDNFLGQNNFLFNAYSFSLRSTDGWLLDPFNYKLYLVPFIPYDASSLTTSLGIIFLIMILSKSLNKKTKFFPVVIVFLVLFTGQIIPRYYLESFLILSFYYTPKHFIPKAIIALQFFATIIMSLGYIYSAYIDNNVIKNKEKYMNKFSFTYFNSKEYNKIDTKKNILNLVEPRDSIFFDDNLFSERTIDIVRVYNNNIKKDRSLGNNFLNDFILNNKIEFIITNKKKIIPNCLDVRKLKDINYKLAVRNYLRKEKLQKIKLFEIKSNNC